MGVGGTLDYLSELLSGGSRHRSYKKKRKQFQTVELKVRMDCEGCELKVRNALSSMKGMHMSFKFQHILKRLRWLKTMLDNPEDIFVDDDQFLR
jgi:hypothetical protein